MTPWEYNAAIMGWAKFQGHDDKANRTYPTEDEFENALARLH